MWVLLIALCAIGAVAVLRRMYALEHPASGGSPQFGNLDEQFLAKRDLTWLHISPALVLVILVPFQFSRRFRARHLQAHRWMGRVAVAIGLLVGASGLALIAHPVGGALEAAAILVFDAIFLVSLSTAFIHARARRIAQHREWMIRAMSVVVGVATVRPVMGVFFATSRMSGLTVQQFFGIAFWIGFSMTYLAGEAWIWYTRRE
jgi:hypothetical protein